LRSGLHRALRVVGSGRRIAVPQGIFRSPRQAVDLYAASPANLVFSRVRRSLMAFLLMLGIRRIGGRRLLAIDLKGLSPCRNGEQQNTASQENSFCLHVGHSLTSRDYEGTPLRKLNSVCFDASFAREAVRPVAGKSATDRVLVRQRWATFSLPAASQPT